MIFPKIERTLLVAGMLLIDVWCAIQLASFFASKAAIARFGVHESATLDPTATSLPTTSRPAAGFQLWSAARIAKYESALARDVQPPIAILRIPRIGLEVPVFNGTDDPTLDRGVGRIIGTAKVGQGGNLAIAGHRDGFFRGLRWLTSGDVVQIVRRGSVDTYQVRSIQIVAPNDISVLRQSAAPTLTLVTCYPFYFVGHAPKRYIITAFLKMSRQIGSTQ